MAREVPAGRRPVERGELLFRPRASARRCRAHLWLAMGGEHGAPVVGCSVCGRIRQGETMPAGREAILP